MCPAPGFNNYHYLAKRLKSIPLPSTHTALQSPGFCLWCFLCLLFFLNSSSLEKNAMHMVGEACLLEDITVGDSLGQQVFNLYEPKCQYTGVFSPGSFVFSDKHQDFCLGGWHLSTNVVCTRKGDDSSFNKLAVYTPSHNGSVPYLMPPILKTL